MIRGVLMASGFAPALLAALGRAAANSKVPVIPGVQEFKWRRKYQRFGGLTGPTRPPRRCGRHGNRRQLCDHHW